MIVRNLVLIIACILLLSSCAMLGLSDAGGTKIPLEDMAPRVSFIGEQKVVVPKSSIDSVDADQVINAYLRLMQSPHAEVKRQATRRLADLTMRLAEEKNALLADGRTVESLPSAIGDASYQKAADLYQQVIDDFPKQADDASIRYQLSRALALEGRTEESLQQLDRLTEVHESSPEMLEVQFRRGEAYFLRKDFARAAKAYQQVLEAGDSNDFYNKALYKHGWSLFKLVDYERALDDFFPLLERLESDAGMTDDLKVVANELVKDTYRAISLSFYHLSGAESVENYFASQGHKPYEPDVYDNLAQLYLSQERFQDAAATYLTFVKTNPMHQKAANFQLKVVDTYIDGGFPSLVLPAKEQFLTQFGVKSDYYKEAPDTLKQSLQQDIVKNLEEVSSHYHATAQAEKNKQSYMVAAEWYSHFLVLLKDDKQKAPYHFLMAEALFDAKEYLQAIKAFDVIAYQYQEYSKKEQAAYNILLGYQALEQQEKANLPKGQSESPQLKQYREASINYSLLFAEYFPNSAQASSLLLRATEQLLAYDRIPEAISSAEKLLSLPGPKENEEIDRAKIIIANGLFDLQQYVDAEKAITRVLNEVALPNNQRESFKERRAQTIYKQAEAYKQQENWPLAIAEYQRMISVEPNASIRPNAEIDVATLMMNLQQWQNAKLALEGFRGRFSSHPLAEGLDEKLALVYEKLENWSDAADAYQRIGSREQDPQKAREIQWYVADLYLKANNIDSAIEAFKAYYWNHQPPFLQAVEAQAKLIDLYQQVGDQSKSDFWRNKIISDYRSGGNKNTDRTRFLAARSAFELAEPLYQSFQSISLTLPLQRSLKQKRQAMDKALKAYGAIGQFKVAEYTTASTHRVGQLYLNLARAILKSERPGGMSEDELEEYQFLIEDQAYPIEEKAIEIFSSNSDRVLNNIYTDWVKRSFEALAALQPARYNKQEAIEPWFGGQSL